MFVISLAMSVALLAVGFFRIHGGPSTKRVPIDALSVMLGPLGLAAFLYGLGEVTRDLAPSLAALAVGAVLLALFAWRQFALEARCSTCTPSSTRGSPWASCSSWWACSRRSP